MAFKVVIFCATLSLVLLHCESRRTSARTLDDPEESVGDLKRNNWLSENLAKQWRLQPKTDDVPELIYRKPISRGQVRIVDSSDESTSGKSSGFTQLEKVYHDTDPEEAGNGRQKANQWRLRHQDAREAFQRDV